MQVYDAYPALINALIGCARQVDQLPLDGMARVQDLVERNGCYTIRGKLTTVDADSLAQHRALLDAAKTFRDAVANVFYVAVAVESPEEAPDAARP